MKIQLAQLALVDGQIRPNVAKVVETIMQREVGVDLIVFPEATLTGFPEADEVHALAEPEDGPTLSAVQAAARAANVSVAVGFAERDGDHCYNTTVLIDPQAGIVLKYRKTHLWSSDVGVFTPGGCLPTALWRGIRVGILICFDIEFPESARALAAQGADLLLVTNGNMDPYGPVHGALITARALENQLFAVMVNRAGEGGGLRFAGESAVVGPQGERLLTLGRDEAMATVELDLSRVADSRRDYCYLRQRRLALRGDVQTGPDGRSFLELT